MNTIHPIKFHDVGGRSRLFLVLVLQEIQRKRVSTSSFYFTTQAIFWCNVSKNTDQSYIVSISEK